MTTNPADILYSATTGSATPSPAPAPQTRAPVPLDEIRAAEILFGGPEPVAGLTDGAAHPGAETPVMRDIVHAAQQRLGMTLGEARESAASWQSIFTKYDVNGSQADGLTQLGVAVKAGALEPDPIAWQADSRAALTAEFGQGADQALMLAQQLVQRDPDLKAFLASTGLGDRREVVLALANRAWNLHKAGKL